MENKNLVDAICEMVKHIHNNASLKRIYNLVALINRPDSPEWIP